jgi:hypothetical protein
MSAITTVGVYLGYAPKPTSNTAITEYTKLCDITDFSDLSGEVERAETTTLSEKVARTYKKTLRNTSDLTFTANYTKTDYSDIQDLVESDKGSEYMFCLLFEQDGSVIEWEGDLTVGITGGGIGETIHMTVTTVALTPPKLNKKTGTYVPTTKKITLAENGGA